MKKLLLICIMIILSILATGCTEQQIMTEKHMNADTGINQEKTRHVNFMGHWHNVYGREDLVHEVVSEFEFLNPDIDVNLKFQDEIMGVRSKVETSKKIVQMIESGNIEWDIIWMDDYIYQLVAEQLNDTDWGSKYMVDFAAVPGFRSTHKDFIFSDPIYKEKTGNMILGPYLEGFTIILWYNKDIADMIGLDIKQYGMTFEDFKEYIKAVADYNNEHGTNIGAIYESSDRYTIPNYLFMHLFRSEVGNLNKIKAEIPSEEKNAALLKTLKAFEKLALYDPLIDSQEDNIWYATRDLVLDDKALFYVHGIWMYGHWKGIDEMTGKNRTQKMIPAEMPVFKDVNYYTGGYIPTWAILKDSPNKDTAIKFLMLWSRPQVAEKWVRYTKAPTAVKGHLTTGTEGQDIYEQFNHVITEKYGENLYDSANIGFILGEENKLLTEDLLEGCIRILKGEATAQEIYDEIMMEVK